MAENRIQQLSTARVYKLLRKSSLKIVDLRPVEAFNGWCTRGETRGGHILGAKSLPAKWTRYIDWPDILKAKKLHPAQTVVLYGYDREETENIALRFLRAGFSDVGVYHEFVSEWSSRPELPMSKLARYRNLVSARWLQSLLVNGNAPEYDNGKFIVCHAHYRNRNAYDQGHIPGAVELDTNSLESPETWNRRSPGEIRKALEETGITSDTTVILYGRYSSPDNSDPFPGSSAGHIGAMRCAFIMLYAGVKDVRILNGGFQAWIDEGFEVTKVNTPKRAVSDFGASIPQHPELAVDLEEAKEILRSPDRNLVCVRSWREYIGEVSGYNYIHKKGRIPGAVFADCGSDAYHMENYRNVDHTTRDYHEIEKIWAESGITPDKHNAFYCGTGWRGSEAFMNAWLMGWPRVSVYDGGWFEWSSHEENPYQTGLPAAQAELAELKDGKGAGLI
ncbi:MAG: rhodanese-like domain-containing protein [Fibrobacterota bacterium]